MYKDYIKTFHCPRKRKTWERTAGFSLKGTWTIVSRVQNKKQTKEIYWTTSGISHCQC